LIEQPRKLSKLSGLVVGSSPTQPTIFVVIGHLLRWRGFTFCEGGRKRGSRLYKIQNTNSLGELLFARVMHAAFLVWRDASPRRMYESPTPFASGIVLPTE
jgi:hypothetical protein